MNLIENLRSIAGIFSDEEDGSDSSVALACIRAAAEILALKSALSEATARAERAEAELKAALLREQYARDQQVIGWLSAENFARIYPGLGIHVSLKVKKGKSDDVALYAHPFIDWEKHAEDLRRLEEENTALKAELKASREQEPYAYEYARSNGDGTWSTHMDKGSLVQTGPASWGYGPPTDPHPERPVIRLYLAPIPAPAAQEKNPVQWLEDEGDLIAIPRGLVGAACSAIDKQRPADKVLSALRYYTMNAPAAQVPHEWINVMRELADDLAIELDSRYQARHQYPSEARKYEQEMKPVYAARALLQEVKP